MKVAPCERRLPQLYTQHRARPRRMSAFSKAQSAGEYGQVRESERTRAEADGNTSHVSSLPHHPETYTALRERTMVTFRVRSKTDS